MIGGFSNRTWGFDIQLTNYIPMCVCLKVGNEPPIAASRESGLAMKKLGYPIFRQT